VKGDDLYLSPAYGRDTAYVNILVFRPYGFEPGLHREYFAKFSTLMEKAGGRPHLAKENEWTAEKMKLGFPKFNNFRQLMKKFDPNRMFSNDYVKRVFDET